MASKCNTGKNPIGPNQPPMGDVKNLVVTSTKYFEVPFHFIASQFTRRYPPEIPTWPTSDMSYTSSTNTPSLHQDSSSNEELRHVTLKELVYRILDTEVYQLRRHTRDYLNSIGKIPIIYKIPRYWASHRRTKPYSGETNIASNINDLIIDTISDVQPIVDITYSWLKKILNS